MCVSLVYVVFAQQLASFYRTECTQTTKGQKLWSVIVIISMKVFFCKIGTLQKKTFAKSKILQTDLSRERLIYMFHNANEYNGIVG